MSHRSPVLVVSIDGVAPRHISALTMPTLVSLARQGASCFSARTVSPPWTLPVHTSMFRGVDPTEHGLSDNTPAPLATDAPSFLQSARDAGLATAAVLNWLPLDAVVEPTATTRRFVIDGGYGPDDDRRSTDAAVAAIAEGDLDLVLVYFSQPDLDGHLYGWDSDEYVAAAGRSDGELGRLLAAVGDDATVLVTTDHGGIGNNHADEVPEVLETFVVVRAPGRVAPATGWATTSPLDVAPTVADLCGFEPDPRWKGRSLVGREVALLDCLVALLERTAAETYGERVTMLEHGLQSAENVRRAGGSDELVVAALLHDIGHVLGDAGEWGVPDHAALAARALQPLLAPAVVEPIRLHVAAKRHRVAVDPTAVERLSPASRATLVQQGGPFSPAEVADFEAEPFAREAQLLRDADDTGKEAGAPTPTLDAFVPALRAALVPAPVTDPAWARASCRCAACRDPSSDQHLLDADDATGWTVISERPDDDGVRRILVHHCTSVRHECVIPAKPAPAPVSGAAWPVDLAEALASEHALDDAAVDRAVDRLTRWGVALLRGCGTEPGTVLRIAERLGHVRETNYGRLFDVVTEAAPGNLAFTPLGLPVHTDNPYRDPRPTVQLLHCLQAAGEGGATRLVDGVAVAETLRTEHPDDFRVLTSTPVLFRFHGDGVDLRAERTLVELAADGSVHSIAVNSRSMEAPRLAPAASARFHRAHRRLVDALATTDHAVELVLAPGDLIAFDNRRVLHGRTAFDGREPRHLQGCYLDIDAVRSRATIRSGARG